MGPMLHEQVAQEQQQQHEQKQHNVSNNVEQHVCKTIVQQHQQRRCQELGNQILNCNTRQDVANERAAPATTTMLLVASEHAAHDAVTPTRTNTQTTRLAGNAEIIVRQPIVASGMLSPHAVAAAYNGNNAANSTKLKTSTQATHNNKNNNRPLLPPHSHEMTIDFNSRRRRGRLRRVAQVTAAATLHMLPATIAPTATPTARATSSSTPLTSSWSSSSLLSSSWPALRWLFMLLLLYCSNCWAQSNALLSKRAQLLSRYILNFVNKITAAAAATLVLAAAAAARIAAATAVAALAINSSNNNNNKQKLKLQHNHRHVPAANAVTRTAANSNNNSNSRCKLSNGSGGCLPGCKRIVYAFILFTTMLPCNHILLASAAKPKSATQSQQQQILQQQEQQQQQQQLYNNRVDGVSFDGSGVLTPPSYQVDSSREDTEFLYPSSQSEEQLFDEETMEDQNAAYETHSNDSSLDKANVTKTPLFPKDLFTKEQLQNGAVACHIIGVIYMFVALAIVCDEFFVPSLDVIIEKLGITDDVAGATFMAAGGSAPELFTSVIGVFVSFDDVGIGTIVGSAVFNILFVIGMCALFSKTVLTLTWWPLFRDCTFYSISLIVLIYFFRDNRIYWWEALILFSIYIAYVAFMKWNVQVERCVKKLITKNKVTRVRSTDQLMPAGNAANSSETSMATQPGGSVTSRAASETRSGPPGGSNSGATGNSSGGTAGSTQTGAKFRHGLLQLMIHTIDPLHDDDVPGKVDEKATQLHAIASLKVLLDATKPQRGGATTSAANHVKINLKETTLADRPNGNIDTTLDSQANEVEDEPEPLSMAWPDTARKRLTYVLVAPLLIPMWLTLPDTRSPRGKKYYAVTFIGSILWIAAFSYLMVWWANVAGDTAGIPPEVMGLTFLAAGTSIPDLITSVIVARKGFGDMAVSSSVGSNIFDVTVGLPIPWLLYGIIYSAPVEVNSVGMICSITILFMMLIFVVMSIACFRWRMNKGLGFTMFLLYFVFVAVSLMIEYDAISCSA